MNQRPSRIATLMRLFSYQPPAGMGDNQEVGQALAGLADKVRPQEANNMLEEFANLPGYALANTIDAAGVAVQPEMVVSALKQLASDPTPAIEGAKDFASEVAERPIALAEQVSIGDLLAPGLGAMLPKGSNKLLKNLGARSKELMQQQLDRGEDIGRLYKSEIGLTTVNDAYHNLATDPTVSKDFGGAIDYQPEAAEYRKILKAQVGNLDNTELARLDRAVQQGFNIDAFHGTKGDITEFDPGLLGVTTDAESSRKGFFFSADAETANSYARQADASKVRKDQFDPQRYPNLIYEQNQIAATIDRMEKNMAAKYPDANQQTIYDMLFQDDDYKKLLKRHDEIEEWIDTGYQQMAGENIMPVKLKLDNPLIHDFKGDSYREQSYDDLLKQAKENGYDGAIFKNTYDGGPLTDVYVVFEPEQIRSRFAMFDPKDAPNVAVNPNWKEELPKLEKLEKRRAFSEKMMNQAYDELQDRNITESKRSELRRQFDIHSDAEYKLSEQIKAIQPKKYAYTGAKDILASAPPVLFPLGVGAAAASYSVNQQQ